MATFPNRIGPYKLLEEIGRGSTARVVRAVDTRDQRIVALKLLFPELLSNPSYADHFMRAGKLGKSLQHQHIAEIYQFGYTEGELYSAMAYADQGTLQDRFQSQKSSMPVSETARILHDVAAALDSALQKGIVHGNIKPSNILFTADGQILLSDFGTADLIEQTPSTRANSAIASSFLAYRSPEQEQPDLPVDARSDVYSLALLTYCMLSGERPAPADGSLAFRRRTLSELSHQAEQEYAQFSQPVTRVLQRALSLNPNERQANASEFVADLAQSDPALADVLLTGSAEKSTALVLKSQFSPYATTTLLRTATPPELQVSAADRTKRIRRYLLEALVVLLLIVGASAIYLNTGSSLRARLGMLGNQSPPTATSFELVSQNSVPVAALVITPTATLTATLAYTVAPTVQSIISPTATVTPQPTATITPTSALTQTDTPTVAPSATDTATATPQPTATATASFTVTPIPLPTLTYTPIPSPTVTATETVTPQPTATATASFTVTPIPLPTLTYTPIPSPTATATATVTPQPTATATASFTITPTPSPTLTYTATPSPTAIATATATPQPTATATASFTVTPTPSPTLTYTATPSATATATATATPQPTATATASFTVTPTPSPTLTYTATPRPTATDTATSTLLPTATSTYTPSVTATPTRTATALPNRIATTLAGIRLTLTARPTSTATMIPLPSSTPTLVPSATLVPTNTPTQRPPTPTDTATPSPTAAPTRNPIAQISVTLLSPPDNTLIRDKTDFVWRSNLPLPEGYSFEPAFWQDEGDPLALGRGWGGSTRETQMSLSPKQFQPGSGRYYWAIRILDANAKPLRLASEIRHITVELPGSPPPSNGGGNPAPAPQPTNTPPRPD